MSERSKQYARARDSVLSTGSPARLAELMTCWAIPARVATMDNWMTVMHLARTGCPHIEDRLRAESTAWLAARGIGSLGDDADVPASDSQCDQSIIDMALSVIFPPDLWAESMTQSGGRPVQAWRDWLGQPS